MSSEIDLYFDSIFNGSFTCISKYLKVKDLYNLSNVRCRPFKFMNRDYFYDLMSQRIQRKLEDIFDFEY